MTLPQGADYTLTENAVTPFQAEPTHASYGGLAFRLSLIEPAHIISFGHEPALK
jgi:hypothetical protein